ncbi:ABC transporter substrate-binding protein [Ruegeria sp.]|uniref:ABC transporter substrate-binding protein n=1 Tax=Ruegeria sp. TaxID=1879320 RepID=UPI00231488FB|nr:ABC transporter substrate-binding protein [Ruegeria sp.]MDA7966423.1 ABC transporter substrate-binding protein [Ruegeria sp.]
MRTYTRRRILGTAISSVAATTLAAPAIAASRKIKIGLATPASGQMAAFHQPVPFILDQIQAATGGKIDIGGKMHEIEIVVKDHQSSPNRASEVAQEMILGDGVDIVTSFSAPETVNPVSDQCELNGVPSISCVCPMEPWFFGRGGDPAVGFDWTFHFSFTGDDYGRSIVSFWDKLPIDKVAGGLWPNDADGRILGDIWGGLLKESGYQVVDPGRFDLPVSNYAAQIAAFKIGDVNAISSLAPGPEFVLFWSQCQQQGYLPKAMVASKSCEFADVQYSLGERAAGIANPILWTEYHPYQSGLTGQTAGELAEDYAASTGRQWEQTLGHVHALMEITFDALRRAEDIDSPDSIRDAIAASKYQSVAGPIDFSSGPFPNTSKTDLAFVQWVKSDKFPYVREVVDNSFAPSVELTAEPILIGG